MMAYIPRSKFLKDVFMFVASLYAYLKSRRPKRKDEFRVAYKFSFGSPGQEPGQFSLGTDVAVSPDGSLIYVAEDTTGQVSILDGSGNFIRRIGNNNPAGLFFSDPYSLAVSPLDQNLYIDDHGGGKIMVVTPDGSEIVRKIGLGSGFDAGYIYQGRNHCVSKSGYVFCSDIGRDDNGTLTSRIQGWAVDGSYLGVFQFNNGPALAVSPVNNNMFISTYPEGEIVQKNLATEEEVSRWPADSPSSLAVDPSGEVVYAVYNSKFLNGEGLSEIRAYKTDGTLLGKFADEFGDQPGQFKYIAHCAATEDKIYVMDYDLSRVSVFIKQ